MLQRRGGVRVCAWACKCVKVKQERRGIFRALHEIRKTCVTISTLVLHCQHMKGKYLNFIFSSTARFSISVHIVLSGGRKLHILSQLCYHTATWAPKCWSLQKLTFSNMASYLMYVSQFVLIQRWAKSNASFLASSEGSLEKPGSTTGFLKHLKTV